MSIGGTYIKAAQLEQRVADASKPLLVCFTRKNHAPSERLAHAIDELSDGWRERLHQVRIDIDEDPGKMDELRVFKVPELMLYADGRIVERSEGEQDLQTLQSWLSYALSRLN